MALNYLEIIERANQGQPVKKRGLGFRANCVGYPRSCEKVPIGLGS